MSLPELLVGMAIGSLVMGGLASILYTTNGIQAAAGDRSKIAGQLANLSVLFDRDSAMASAAATAKAQTSATSCTTVMSLGAASYQMTASTTNGPNVIQRTAAAGTRIVARYVSACAWQAVSDSGGRASISMTLTLRGPTTNGVVSLTQTLRGAPRLW